MVVLHLERTRPARDRALTLILHSPPSRAPARGGRALARAGISRAGLRCAIQAVERALPGWLTVTEAAGHPHSGQKAKSIPILVEPLLAGPDRRSHRLPC